MSDDTNTQPENVAPIGDEEEVELPPVWQLAKGCKYADLTALLKKDPSQMLVPNPANGDILLAWAVRCAPAETGLVDLILAKKGRDAFVLDAALLAVFDAWHAFKLPPFEAPEDTPDAKDERVPEVEFVKAQLAIEGQTLKEHQIRKVMALGIIVDFKNGSERRCLFSNGDLYVGGFRDGARHGRGLYVHRDSDARYVGVFRNGHKQGFGIMTYPDGSRYEGTYANGVRSGVGVYVWPAGDVYRGKYVAGKKDNKGEYVYAHGQGSISAVWVQGEPDAAHGQKPVWTLPKLGCFEGVPFAGSEGVFKLPSSGTLVKGRFREDGTWEVDSVVEIAA
jgi:hypothetical protein